MRNAFSMIFDKNKRFLWLAYHGFYNKWPDRKYISRKFEATLGYPLNLDNPQTFNEKLQWLKLYDRKPIYTTMVDKYAVKEYVASIIGEEYIIPTLGVWEHFEDINFDDLPNQFVLKCTHDSGGLVIVKDKSKLDMPAAKRKINKSLKRNYYYLGREWPYKDVKPRIIAEAYMEDASSQIKNGLIAAHDFGTDRKDINGSLKKNTPLIDYKVYTFNGEAKFCMINQERKIHTRADYFDRDYKWLDFKWGYDHADIIPQKPESYEQMFKLAERLAKDTAELRVDFYEVNGHIYFGELTFFDGSGFDKIEPIEWDYKLGSFLTLPNMK